MSKPSFLERAVSSFLTDNIVTGFKHLMEKRMLPFSIAALGLLVFNIISMILYSQQVMWFSLEAIKRINLAGFLVATCFVFLGLLSGVWKRYFFQLALVFTGAIACVAWIFYANPDPSWLPFQALKLAFLLVWVLISSLSLFFLVFYFFTGLPGRAVTAGKSVDHIFLGPFIKLGAFATLVLSVWLILANMTPTAMLIGFMGTLSGMIILWMSTFSERTQTSCNFITILGLYLFYVAYHISASISPSQNIPNILTELILLIITSLYSVQGMAKRAKDLDASRLEEKELGRQVFFQERFAIFGYLKRVFGDLSLMLAAVGFSTGYFLFILSMYIDPALPLIGSFFDISLGLPVFSHRLFSLISLLIFFIMLILFEKSESFRDFATNKYTFQQGVEVVKDKIKVFGRRFLKERFGRHEEEGKED